ncbi:HAD-IIB family hydrolase [Arthrobacter sp. PAMC25284]|uniref:HAD-IIB family hydrolase n=1 Tax=Arthrobacter sp. PAMC25284 TaxID=2861279 RepID=UPI001C63127C|nr:HAD-IIB family hydrolase [Arthrobacter sp. PAMC25284]QYF89548.1 HAD family hydrolase [Arthrobacter sp. PAMC25284]
MNQERTLLVTDLDGTLLTTQSTLTKRTRAALQQATEGGLRVTCATARSLTSARKLLKTVDFQLPVILHNGAVTADLSSGQIALRKDISPRSVKLMVRACRDAGISPLIHTFAAQESVAWVKPLANQYIDNFWAKRPDDPRRSACKGWEELPSEAVICVSALGDARRIRQLAAGIQRLSLNVDVSLRSNEKRDGAMWMEVLAAGVCKGTAVRDLAALHGITRIVVVGDDVNDISMFDAAHEAYAVGNAHWKLKSKATAILASNDRDGVAWLIERLVRTAVTVEN